MPADLVTRLLLKNDQFDKSIKESQKQMQSFDKMSKVVSKGVTASFTQIAGIVGVATGGIELFDKTMMSAQTTGDAFVRVQDQAKASVDAFFSSIAMGDFSGFIHNLENIIKKAGELADIMDELGTKSLFTNAEVRALEQQRRIQTAIAQDRSRSEKERRSAQMEAEKAVKEISKLQRSLAETETQAGYQTIRSALSKQGFAGDVTNEQINQLAKETNRSYFLSLAKNYKEDVAWVNSRRTKANLDLQQGRFEDYEYDVEAAKRAKEDFDKMLSTEKGALSQLAYYFYEMDDAQDSQLANALNMINALGEINALEAERLAQLGTIEARLDTQANKEKKAASKIFSDGSLAKIGQDIKEYQDVLEKSTDRAVIAGAQQAIDKLNAQKKEVEIRLRWDSYALSYEWEKELQSPKTIAKVSVPDLPKIDKVVTPKDISLNFDYAESLQSISSALGSVTNMVNNDAAGWLSWSANILTATAAAIPAIKAITNAQAAAAVTGAAASASAIPVVGWINAIAAVAALTAAFANIPKFASGGIVGGSSFAGDRVPVLANSGEMVLNDKQQRNLFNLLNAGGDADNGQMSYTIKVKGEDLYIALGNYNKRKSKVR